MKTSSIAIAISAIAGGYLLLRPKSASAQPNEPTHDPDEPDEPTFDPDEPDEPDGPVVVEPTRPEPKPTTKPKGPSGQVFTLAPWDSPDPSTGHGIPLDGSTIVGSGKEQDDGVTFFEWRLRKTPITFTCAGELAICRYVFESRGVRTGLWETLREADVVKGTGSGNWALQRPTAEILDTHRSEHLRDFENEKGLFGG